MQRRGGSGRPRKVTKRTDRLWAKICEADDEKTAKQILQEGPVHDVNVRTVQRHLIEQGMECGRRYPKALISHLHADERVVWCKRRRGFNFVP